MSALEAAITSVSVRDRLPFGMCLWALTTFVGKVWTTCLARVFYARMGGSDYFLAAAVTSDKFCAAVFFRDARFS
ncbi:Uncharacterised protein [Dermatophilus congolensis]|uniref:Uncharacterized protein n=1 Tax=Dermatophilus congolensis TaxID=1863 RepID=A0A239VUL4_9MICO|nr:Uncharacterised protein [Dermatophilus congolensis]